MAGATEGFTRQMLGVPRPDAYKLTPSVFATAPSERMGKLLAAAYSYARKESAATVLSKLDGLDPSEANTAFMRGLGTLALGGRPNAEAGLALLRLAADSRHSGAMALYGLAKINPPAMIDKEPAEGRSWLQRAVDAGDGQAAYLLGHAYLSGWAGVADPAKSVNLFRKAADAGHVDAMKVLGTMAMLGQGMPRDYVNLRSKPPIFLLRCGMATRAVAAIWSMISGASLGEGLQYFAFLAEDEHSPAGPPTWCGPRRAGDTCGAYLLRAQPKNGLIVAGDTS